MSISKSCYELYENADRQGCSIILLLGKEHLVQSYAIGLLGVKIEDIMHCPEVFTHFTELDKWVDRIRYETSFRKNLVVTTQRQDMIDALLNSDLEFSVITVRIINENTMTGRTLGKEEAKSLREGFNIELRI